MEGQENNKVLNNSSSFSDVPSERPIVWSAHENTQNSQLNQNSSDENTQNSQHVVWTTSQIQKQSEEQIAYRAENLKLNKKKVAKENKITFFTVFGAIMSLSCCGLFLFNVYFLICNLLDVDVPFINKGIVYVVTDACAPDIEKESYCIYVKDSNNVGVGDYIFYNDKNENLYIEKVGAVVEKNGQVVYAVGDDNNILVESNQYIGVYEKSSLLIAKFVGFCNSVLGYLIMIVLPVGVCLAYEIICGAKERKLAFNSADNNFVTKDGKVVNASSLTSTKKELKELKQWAKESVKQNEDIYKKQE